MTSRIMGTGSYLPELAVTNDDLAKIMDTSDEWISSRTGIRQRRLVKDETTFKDEPRNLCMDMSKAKAQGVRFHETLEGFHLVLESLK